MVITLAGSTMAGYQDGPSGSALFNNPSNIALDSQGNIFLSDSGNNVIRKIATDGMVITVAGSTLAGYQDGLSGSALFSSPSGIAIDSQDDIFVSDSGNNVIRKITTVGMVITVAGSTMGGYQDGITSSALFNRPSNIFFRKNKIFVSDSGNNAIREINLGTDMVTTLAGSTLAGYQDGLSGSALFNNPAGLVIDSQGNIFVSDSGNNVIRKIATDELVSTVAGTTLGGYQDGSSGSASFNNPTGLGIDSQGKLIIVDSGNSILRTISLDTTGGTGLTGLNPYDIISLSGIDNGTPLIITEYIADGGYPGSTYYYIVDGNTSQIIYF